MVKIQEVRSESARIDIMKTVLSSSALPMGEPPHSLT